MLHGNPTWSFFYRRLIERLRPHVRCIVPDHLGMGLSDTPAPQQATELLTLPQRIGHLRELLAHCGVQHYSLVAHDWGGPIGLGLALGVGHSAVARRPLPVQRCVLMNTAAFTSGRPPLSIALCRLPVLGQWLVQQANAFVRGSLRWASRQRLSAQVATGYQAPYTQARYRLGIHRFVQDIPLGAAHPSWETLAAIEQRLPALNTLPTLLCWGMQDFCFTPQFLDEFRKRIPYAAVHRSAQAGHYLLEDDPALVDSLLPQFLLA
jgi:haloalkane dehalogenase